MRIGIIGSMRFTEQMVATRDELQSLGHDPFLTEFHAPFLGKSAAEKESIKAEQREDGKSGAGKDSIREFWDLMQGADAVLVMNLDKNGVKNYIGANTLLEMGFAHALKQKIFLLNPIPNQPYCREEIEAMQPIVIDGDPQKIA